MKNEYLFLTFQKHGIDLQCESEKQRTYAQRLTLFETMRDLRVDVGLHESFTQKQLVREGQKK